MKQYVESAQRRQERIANHVRLSTKVIQSKKTYDRTRAKQDLRRAKAEA